MSAGRGSKRRPLLNQTGAITLSTKIWLFFITLFIYAGYIVVPPYFAYYMLKTEVEEEAELADKLSDATMAANILKKAVVWEVPIRIEDIVISRGLETIDIRLDYSTQVEPVPGYVKVITFHISVTEQVKESSGVLR